MTHLLRLLRDFWETLERLLRDFWETEAETETEEWPGQHSQFLRCLFRSLHWGRNKKTLWHTDYGFGDCTKTFSTPHHFSFGPLAIIFGNINSTSDQKRQLIIYLAAMNVLGSGSVVFSEGSISQDVFLLYSNWISWLRGADLVTEGRWTDKQILILAASKSIWVSRQIWWHGLFLAITLEGRGNPNNTFNKWQNCPNLRLLARDRNFVKLYAQNFNNFDPLLLWLTFLVKSRLWFQNLSIEMTNPDNLNRFMEFKHRHLCCHTTKYVLVLQFQNGRKVKKIHEMRTNSRGSNRKEEIFQKNHIRRGIILLVFLLNELALDVLATVISDFASLWQCVGKWSKFGFNLLFTQSLLWWQILSLQNS